MHFPLSCLLCAVVIFSSTPNFYAAVRLWRTSDSVNVFQVSFNFIWLDWWDSRLVWSPRLHKRKHILSTTFGVLFSRLERADT